VRFDAGAHAAAIERDGYTIIEDFLDAARLSEVRRVLGFYLGSHTGRNPFEGRRTERVYTLVARGRVFWDIVLDERVLALADRFLLPGCLLTASQAICIRPGEQPQDLHHDDTFYTVPRLAFSNQYCQPWARQQENFLQGVPVEVARQMPRRLQEMLGYSIYPPFMGQLTASHPVKLLEPGFENRVETQARAAGARLPE
jgi:ectoine hydroxylase-related dioxygenase (phytanoyl-CoA dioxygenase family)